MGAINRIRMEAPSTWASSTGRAPSRPRPKRGDGLQQDELIVRDMDFEPRFPWQFVGDRKAETYGVLTELGLRTLPSSPPATTRRALLSRR